MKKSALVLSMMLALSLFMFTGCGGNDQADMNGNGTTTEQNDGSIVDETEKGVDDMGNAVEDGMEDMADDAEDMMDGNDGNTTNNNNDNNNNTNQ